MKIKIYTKKTQTTKVGIQKTAKSTKKKEKGTLCDISPSLHCLSPLSCPKTPKLTLQIKKLGSTEI